MKKFDGDPDFAEAELSRESQAFIRAEQEVDEAKDRLEGLEQQFYASKDDDKQARLNDLMNEVDAEISRLQTLADEAEAELDRTINYWKDEGYIS